MQKSTLDAIKILSKADKKSLVGKALKLTEECGELAGEVLPYEDSFATNHRIATKESVLEEVADVILCALSVAYDIDASDEEIDSMLIQKMNKWSYLQSRDEQAKWPIPFEIHVTVKEGDLILFKEACLLLGVKPLLLHLQTDTMGIIPDLMTSSVIMGKNSDAIEHVNNVKFGLIDAGFQVVRCKIESAPWHPLAPQTIKDIMPPGCYFETHFAVKTNKRDDLYVWSIGYNMAEKCKVKLSKNAFKITDGYETIMLTYREYEKSRDVFEKNVQDIKDKLIDANFYVEKTITEFAIYDTRETHDKEWMTK